MKNQRTYYGFQIPTAVYPGGMDIVTTSKPSGYQVKCRASNVTEAREKLDQLWSDICEKALVQQNKNNP